MKRIIVGCAMGIVWWSVGCIPERRVVWSPDGSRAAVVAADGLRFCTPKGELSALRVPGAHRVAWFPDGRRIVCIHSEKARRWSEATALLSATEQKDLIVAAGELRRQCLAYGGPHDKFKARFDPPRSDGQQAAMMLFLREQPDRELPAKMGEQWKDIQSFELDVWKVETFDVNGTETRSARKLAGGFDEPREPMVAPNGSNVAFLVPSPRGGEFEFNLMVVPADGSAAPRLVEETVALGFDWSPDGRSLAYQHAPPSADTTANTVRLGALAAVEVADASGRLHRAWSSRQDRAGLLYGPFQQVRWLRDGRLIFSSIAVTLPATNRDMPQHTGLFMIDPRMGATVQRLLPLDFDPTVGDVTPFDVSPDGANVLITTSKGRSCVYEVATGATRIIDSSGPDGELRGVATWRNNKEICLVVQPGSSMGTTDRAQVILWQENGRTNCLSRNWPEEAVKDWLTPKPKGPTTQSAH